MRTVENREERRYNIIIKTHLMPGSADVKGEHHVSSERA